MWVACMRACVCAKGSGQCVCQGNAVLRRRGLLQSKQLPMLTKCCLCPAAQRCAPQAQPQGRRCASGSHPLHAHIQTKYSRQAATLARPTPTSTGLSVGAAGERREGEKGDSAVVPFLGDSGGCGRGQGRRPGWISPGAAHSAEAQGRC